MLKIFFCTALAASVLLALPLVARSDSGHGEKGHETVKGGHHGGYENTTPMTASLADAWSALIAARDAIAHDVERGELNDVHAKAQPIPNLTAELLAKSGDLDSGKRTRVEAAAKQLARIADALHDAADAGDASRTRKELSRLDGLLELIRAQYPSGALDTGAHGEHGHQDHSAGG